MSDILDAVLEMASSLHSTGVIDARKMRKYQALCEPLPDYTSEDVAEIRKEHHLSQVALASLFGVSPATVRSWEQGKRRIQGPSKKLLSLLERKGLKVLLN